MIRRCGVLIGLWLAVSSAAAHPRHVTWAEMRYNEDTRLFEVSLQVAPEDLATALRRDGSGPVALARPEQVNPRLQALLDQHFRVQADGRQLTLDLLGYEYSHKSAWVHFELAGAAMPVQRLEIANTLLLESLPEQANTTVIRIGEFQQTVVGTRNDPAPVIIVTSRQ